MREQKEHYLLNSSRRQHSRISPFSEPTKSTCYTHHFQFSLDINQKYKTRWFHNIKPDTLYHKDPDPAFGDGSSISSPLALSGRCQAVRAGSGYRLWPVWPTFRSLLTVTSSGGFGNHRPLSPITQVTGTESIDHRKYLLNQSKSCNLSGGTIRDLYLVGCVKQLSKSKHCEIV